MVIPQSNDVGVLTNSLKLQQDVDFISALISWARLQNHRLTRMFGVPTKQLSKSTSRHNGVHIYQIYGSTRSGGGRVLAMGCFLKLYALILSIFVGNKKLNDPMR